MQVCRRFCFEKQGHFLDEFVDGLEPERCCHAAVRAHHVDGEWEAGRVAVDGRVFKEKGFAAVWRFHLTVGPLGNFEFGGDGAGDAFEFA